MTEDSKLNILRSMSPNNRNILITSISGGMAGLTEAILTPFERVQALLQIPKYHDSYRHTWHVFQDVTKAHGFNELYRGMSAICMRNAFSNSLFFSLRIPMKEMFPETDNKFENSIYDFLNGALIGAVLSTMFFPLNVVKSNMQANVGGDFPGIYKTFMVVYEQRDRKLAGMFKGVGGNFTRALLAWGITNSVYELILSSFKN